ncbi:MAG: tetratricopeptide repeat protein [Candidatus Omnitrophica bacterium]|nr:tetratricopeptide repeat protein [Candidatus Omnitrophota bacterium]
MKNFLFWVVLALVAVAYSPSLFNGFIKNDDPGHLLENPTLRSLSPENIRAMFLDIINTTYIPLTTFSFALEYNFLGYNPFVYHLDNLLLHLAVTALVFFFFRKMGLSEVAAAIGAFFFGIHPLHVESVAWVTERKDVLYAFFYMLAVHQYWRYVKSSDRRYYWVSVMCCFLSVLAKPMALSLPLILLLCDWWMGRTWSLSIIFEKVLYFIIVIPIAGITYAYNVRVPWNSVGEAMMLWMWCGVFYIRKFIFPGELIVFYQYPKPLSWANLEFIASGLLFLFVVALVFYFRRNKLFVFSVLFYFLSIFFLFRFDDLENINPVSDRFMYLPSVGFCALIGFWFAKFLEEDKNKKIALVLLVCLGFLLTAKTFMQCRLWRNASTLWSAVIKHSPNLAMAYVHRGAEYHEKGELLAAVADYRKAIELKNDPYARSNLAMIFKEAGRYQDAIAEYTRSIETTPAFWGAYFDRGNLYREIGKYPLAIADYTKVLKILPGYAEAYENRGTAYFLSDNEPAALADFNFAVRFNPRSINATNNRAVIFAKQGKFDKAVYDFSRSIRLDPTNPSVYFNRGLAYSQSGKYDLAIADFDQALRLDPNYKEAYLQKMEITGKSSLKLK